MTCWQLCTDWVESYKLGPLLGTPILSWALPPGALPSSHGEDQRKTPSVLGRRNKHFEICPEVFP